MTLAGGDTAESPDGILADIVVVGTVPKGKGCITVGGEAGRPDLCEWGIGRLGGCGLAMRTKPKRKLNPREYPRHFFPEPRIELGRVLREKGLASAMIDTSDGLSTDLAHICEESGVGAELRGRVIPRAVWANRRGRSICNLPCTGAKTTSCCSRHARASGFRPASPEFLSRRSGRSRAGGRFS